VRHGVCSVIRIGVDFGGTKIEAAALAPDGTCPARMRVPTPDSYDAALAAIRDLVAAVESQTVPVDRVGVGMPGTLSPRTGLVRNANALYLNGRRFDEDLAIALGKQVRVSNDANCFAVSEAVDGAGTGARVVFAAILGTGCGGGVVVDGRLLGGGNGIGGEWGHNPLPWPDAGEMPGPRCWCGASGCLEGWISGSGFGRDHLDRSGVALDGAAIVAAMRAGDRTACASFDRYLDRLSRALATIANILDPDVFILGGGMANVEEIYAALPQLIRRHVFCDVWDAPVRKARWGDSSGVRGAARLWA
jgi:fructokinase